MHTLKRWHQLLRLDAVLLVVAVVAGIAGAMLAARYLGNRGTAMESLLRERYEPRAVVVASRDVPAGQILDASYLAVRQMPKEFLPADAMPADRAAEVVGARAAIQISRGTPVVGAALQDGHVPARLASLLRDGRRALTIAVDQVNSQAGNLQPGDWVDLYYSRSTDGDAVLIPLLQHVEVLAAGASLRDGVVTEPDGAFGTITLGLMADDVARVVLAQQSGSVSVALRSPDDNSQMPATARNSRELLRVPARSATTGDSRIELLVGGQGARTPERSWLSVGKAQVQTGDPS